MSIENRSKKHKNKTINQNDISSSFSVFCLTSHIDNSIKYSHWSEGLEMFIKKDGVILKLNSEEIQKIVKSLPRTLGGSY